MIETMQFCLTISSAALIDDRDLIENVHRDAQRLKAKSNASSTQHLKLLGNNIYEAHAHTSPVTNPGKLPLIIPLLLVILSD